MVSTSSGEPIAEAISSDVKDLPFSFLRKAKKFGGPHRESARADERTFSKIAQGFLPEFESQSGEYPFREMS